MTEERITSQTTRKKFTKWLLTMLGVACVAFGLLGIFLPVLPTTPFLLLAAFLFARSSPGFHHWLLGNRWFGEYIRRYREGRGLPLRQILLTLILLWMIIGFSAVVIVKTWWLQIILVGIAAGVSIHLLRSRSRIEQPAALPATVDRNPPEGSV